MTEQQHHTNKVNDPHHRTGQIIGHVEDLEQRAIKGMELNPLPDCSEEEYDAVNVEKGNIEYLKFRSQQQDFQTPLWVRTD